jgi:amidase
MSINNPPMPLPDWTIEQLATALRQQEVTITDVAQAYVDRIMSLDANGPNAVITLNPFWKEQAARLQETLFSDSPMLHGIPILIKDNIDTIDMGNSAGSIALGDIPVDQNALLVEQLTKAGALILGKTNLSEWANFRSTDSTSGWSSLGGQTRNAYSLAHNPSGSSSGSGAAIAANFAVAAVGTETDGSIISPSSHNALVGLKPTLGRVSRTGIIPIAWSQDTAGPMTKTVKDAATMLQYMDASDKDDAATLSDEKQTEDYSRHCQTDFIKGKRIGYLKPDERFPDSVSDAFFSVIETLMAAGARCVELDPVPSMVTLQDHEITQMTCEFPEALQTYFETRRNQSPYKSVGDLIQFNLDHQDKVLARFKQEWFDLCLQAPGTQSEAYKSAQKAIQVFRQELQTQWLDEHELDAIVTASNGPAWVIEESANDKYTGGNSYIGAVTGWPSITVPFKFLDRLPLGANFVAPAWQEAKLLGIAYGFEQQISLSKPSLEFEAQTSEETLQE